jgi:4-hydroxyproline epimerase
VGPVTATVREDGAVTIENVPSYRAKKDVAVQVEGIGEIKGDVAWGGNWFYLTKDVGVEVTKANLAKLTDVALRIREALNNTHPEVDHIEIFGPPEREDADSRNFVLCPGGAYDRSPCGTGTSAKLACLYADGVISEGQIWRQESIIGSLLEGSVRVLDGDLIPSISGRAYITSEATLLMDEADPFCFGI